MNAFKRTLVGLAVASALAAGAAQAQISDGIVKIGVLSDMSSLYTDLAGAGSVAAGTNVSASAASIGTGNGSRHRPQAVSSVACSRPVKWTVGPARRISATSDTGVIRRKSSDSSANASA